MYISVAGQPNENLGATGKKFVTDFGATQIGARSEPVLRVRRPGDGRPADGDRELGRHACRGADELFEHERHGRHPRHFSINANGDTNNNPVTQYLIKSGQGDTVQDDHAADEPVKAA